MIIRDVAGHHLQAHYTDPAVVAALRKAVSYEMLENTNIGWFCICLGGVY